VEFVTNEEILSKLKDAFSQVEFQVQAEETKDFTVVVPAASIVDVATHLRDHLGFDYLSDVTSVDHPDRFEVVYHLYSIKRGGGVLTLKVQLADKEHPEVESITPIWPGANYQEREVYDLMGISFKNHPDLRRIMMWDGFPGHPLRKDFENRLYTFKELEPTRPKPPDW
jgi:NADH/F420H2 dehydrogenase subunit C